MTKKRVTYNRVNAAIAKYGVGLFNAGGYQAFYILEGFPDDTIVPDSVWIPLISHLSVEDWEAHVKDAQKS